MASEELSQLYRLLLLQSRSTANPANLEATSIPFEGGALSYADTGEGDGRWRMSGGALSQSDGRNSAGVNYSLIRDENHSRSMTNALAMARGGIGPISASAGFRQGEFQGPGYRATNSSPMYGVGLNTTINDVDVGLDYQKDRSGSNYTATARTPLGEGTLSGDIGYSPESRALSFMLRYLRQF